MTTRELRIIAIVESFKRFYDLDFVDVNIIVIKLSTYTDAQLRLLERNVILTDFSKFTFGGFIDFLTLHKYARKRQEDF